jgi:ketosteroid isomerase-like protein
MNYVTIGKGKLAGKGVYAARDFKKDELVVAYNLKELTQAEFDKLPVNEREWTHSFWGKIYLFPEPGRYVNHDDNPSTYPDLDRMGDFALRPIKKGEAITINDKIELQHELDTFLKAYEKASNSCDFDNVAPLIADEATYWFTNGIFEGKPDIRKAFENTWSNIRNETYTISSVTWVVATYWVSACTYKFKSDGLVNGKRQVYEGHGTNILRRIDGSWRIVHEHLSKS